MKVELFSLTQGGETVLSFMSQAVGLMAEVDFGLNICGTADSYTFSFVVVDRPPQIDLDQRY